MAYIVNVENNLDPVDTRGAGQAAEEIRAIKSKLKVYTIDGSGNVSFNRNLSLTQTLNVTGNVTIGTTTGNSHVVVGSATVTNGLYVIGGIQSISDGESQVQTVRTGTGGSSFYLYNNGTQQGIYDDVQGGLLTGTKSGNTTLAAGTGTRITALFIDNNRNFYRVIPGGSGLYADFACRAWVNFNGTNGAIRASGNVTSVSRTAAGQYTINFAAAMPDNSYCAVGNCGTGNAFTSVNGDDNPLSIGGNTGPGIQALTQLRVSAAQSGGMEDTNQVTVSVFR